MGAVVQLLGWMLAMALPIAVSAATAPAATGSTARAQALFDLANHYWQQTFTAGGSYTATELGLFDRQIRNVCAEAGALTGPFYCPADLKTYLDQEFLRQVAQRAGSPDVTDYALAYVIGHELGLHIQNLVGTTDAVREARSNSSPALSARTWMTQELQADCYAGLWLRSATQRGVVKSADPGAALGAVAAVSQTWQAQHAGATMVDPLLTYGDASLRLRWFRRGLDSGRFNDCDTFGAEAAGKLQ